MQSDNKKIIEDFESEMWLYIEESLPADRMKFWTEHINNSAELKQMLEDTTRALSLYADSIEIELNEKTYDEIIESVTSKQKGIWNFYKNIFDNYFAPAFNSYRLAFGAAIIIVFIVVTSIIEKPNGNGIDTNSSLDWKGSEFTSRLDDVDSSINAMKSENTFEHQLYYYTKDKFDVAIESIGDRIEKLKDNMKNELL